MNFRNILEAYMTEISTKPFLDEGFKNYNVCIIFIANVQNICDLIGRKEYNIGRILLLV